MKPIRTIISRLEHAVQCGDWHDKPLHWQVLAYTEADPLNFLGECRQLFRTKREAELYARIRRRPGMTQMQAIHAWLDHPSNR